MKSLFRWNFIHYWVAGFGAGAFMVRYVFSSDIMDIVIASIIITLTAVYAIYSISTSSGKKS